jgi:hypothetical protein
MASLLTYCGSATELSAVFDKRPYISVKHDLPQYNWFLLSTTPRCPHEALRDEALRVRSASHGKCARSEKVQSRRFHRLPTGCATWQKALGSANVAEFCCGRTSWLQSRGEKLSQIIARFLTRLWIWADVDDSTLSAICTRIVKFVGAGEAVEDMSSAGENSN